MRMKDVGWWYCGTELLTASAWFLFCYIGFSCSAKACDFFLCGYLFIYLWLQVGKDGEPLQHLPLEYLEAGGDYPCPLYTSDKRGWRYKGSESDGGDALAWVGLPSGDYPPAHWVRRGVAVLATMAEA